MSEKTGWYQKRFDIAGAHPDEAHRAVANIAEAVKEIQPIAGVREWRGDMGTAISKWLQRKPMRYGHVIEADVQAFLERGVKIMDDLKGRMPLGFSKGQQQVRDRADELAKSMQKVLAQREDQKSRFDPWRRVKITCEPARAWDDERAWSAQETRDAVLKALRQEFPRGPAQASRARAEYLNWEQKAERLGVEEQMNAAARSWKSFDDKIEYWKWLDGCRKEIWAEVYTVDSIDFTPALQFRQSYQSKPKMRM